MLNGSILGNFKVSITFGMCAVRVGMGAVRVGMGAVRFGIGAVRDGIGQDWNTCQGVGIVTNRLGKHSYDRHRILLLKHRFVL